MAKVKLTLDNRKNSMKKDGTFPLVLSLSHKRRSRLLSLDYALHPGNWDAINQVVKSVSNHKHITAKVKNQLTKAKYFLISRKIEIDSMSINELRNHILTEIHSNEETNENSKNLFLSKRLNSKSIIDYSKVKLSRLKQANRVGYSEAIHGALRSLKKFTKTTDILFAEIDVSFLKNYTAYCIGRGNKPNTISAYLRPIKTLFNEAIQEDVIPQELYPFKGFKMPRAKETKKRSLKMKNIIDIRELELKEKSALWDARNYFLFMFNNMGINFIDIARLQKSQIKDVEYKNKNLLSGRLLYTRSKNQRQYSIKLTNESIDILNSYDFFKKKKDDLVFPIGYEDSAMGRRTYKKKRQRINGRLRTIGGMVGLEENITSYYARHTWATIAKRKMIPVSVIAEGLGHSDLKTTQIYLDSFDDKTLDDANDSIVS